MYLGSSIYIAVLDENRAAEVFPRYMIILHSFQRASPGPWPTRRTVCSRITCGRNDLRENTHSHHCQLWVPGLHVHVVPCLKLPVCSLGTHSLLLKNSNLCIVGTTPTYCDLADAALPAPYTLSDTHIEKVTQSLWVTSQEELFLIWQEVL